MDLQQLQNMGGFVPQAPEVREISWTRQGPDGEPVTDTFTVRVKKLSAGIIERMWADAGKQPNRSYTATLISEAILLGDEGTERISYESAFNLDPGLAEVLLEDAVHAVNPLHRRKGTAAKN
jgi:hypothetical protein